VDSGLATLTSVSLLLAATSVVVPLLCSSFRATHWKPPQKQWECH